MSLSARLRLRVDGFDGDIIEFEDSFFVVLSKALDGKAHQTTDIFLS
jgi:hypothetical protein